MIHLLKYMQIFAKLEVNHCKKVEMPNPTPNIAGHLISYLQEVLISKRPYFFDAPDRSLEIWQSLKQTTSLSKLAGFAVMAMTVL